MGGDIKEKDGPDCLKVQMLGDFSMEYRGKPVLNRMKKASKVSHLLQILLYTGSGGIRREVLLSRLYGGDGSKDRANNLRVTVYHLRKILRETELSDKADICIRNGMYAFESDCAIEIDAHLFDELHREAETAQGSRRLELLKKACAVYGGYFLPLLSGEEWVAVEDAHYQRGYTRCVEEVCRLLKEQGDYEELLRLCGRAAALYPFDEWQIWQVDGLMALGRLRESAELYERTVDLYREEFPVQPPEQMSHCLRRMEDRMRTETEDLHQIREYLREKGAGAGAYYCSYPGFVDSYRIAARMAEGPGQAAYLLLCSILDERKRRPTGTDSFQEVSEALKNSIKESLNPEDIFTRYGKGQFLAILSEADPGECQRMISRIDESFRRREKSRRLRITYRILPVADSGERRRD